MNDVVRAVACLARGFEITNITADQTNLLDDMFEIFLFPGREIVEHRNVMAAPQQFINDIRADEAGTTRHQVAHLLILLRKERVVCGKLQHWTTFARFFFMWRVALRESTTSFAASAICS